MFKGLKDKLKDSYNAAAKTGKAVIDDAKLQATDTLNTLSILVNENTPEGEAPKDLTLKERMGVAYGHVSKTEWLKVAKDTAQDLTKKDELKRLAGTVIALPGGLAVYGAYRVAKHHQDKAEEQKAEAAKQAAKAAKKPRKPKTPKAPAA
ncbi:MAG: hypothetical protein PSY14_11315 [bacterium]|nr:hypothetical protein [bacterium]